MKKLEITIEKFVKLKEELKKFRKSIFGKKDKINLCQKYGVTSDDLVMTIKYLGYEKRKEKNLN
jgi:hypothetical protein